MPHRTVALINSLAYRKRLTVPVLGARALLIIDDCITSSMPKLPMCR